MTLGVFNGFESEATQLDYARVFISQLRSARESSVPVKDYKAAVILAGVIYRQDKELLVSLIEIFSSFVRITRNEKGAFAFRATILDHVDNRFRVAE